MAANLGIEFIEFGTDYLVAKMPVDHRTIQPMGILHGGANAALAETLGSVAAMLTISDHHQTSIVGIEINANHLKSVKQGWVIGTVKPIRVGRLIQVWDIKIVNESGQAICVSRLTTATVNRT